MKNNEIKNILKTYGFKINKKFNSFYKYLKRKDNFIVIRLSNHFNHKMIENEKLINYKYKSEKDLLKLINKIIIKFKLKEVKKCLN